MEGTPFVAVANINKSVYVVIRQQVNQTIHEIAINESQFSGLMYALKAIEEKMTEEERAKNVAEAVEQCLYDPSAPAYDGGPATMYDPAMPAYEKTPVVPVCETTPVCEPTNVYVPIAPKKSRKRKLKIDV